MPTYFTRIKKNIVKCDHFEAHLLRGIFRASIWSHLIKNSWRNGVMLDKGLIYDLFYEFSVKITITIQRKILNWILVWNQQTRLNLVTFYAFDSIECMYKCSIIIMMSNNTLLPSCSRILHAFSINL